MTWWLGDVTGNLIVAPLIVLWIVERDGAWNRSATLEVALLLVLLVVLAELVFGGWFPDLRPRIIQSLSSADRS